MKFMFCMLAAMLVFSSCAHKNVIQRSDQNAEIILKPYINMDSTIKKLIDESVGYVIYPRVSKGAIGIGGAYGEGDVYEHTSFGYQLVGKSELSQINIGLQLGAKTFTEVIFFANYAAFERFKRGKMEFNAEVSGVALSSAKSASAVRIGDITIVIANDSGLMGELSVGGQKLSYRSL